MVGRFVWDKELLSSNLNNPKEYYEELLCSCVARHNKPKEFIYYKFIGIYNNVLTFNTY